MRRIWFSSFFLVGGFFCINAQEIGQECAPSCHPALMQEAPEHFGTESPACSMPPASCPVEPEACSQPPPCCEPSFCGKSSYLQAEPLPISCSSSYNFPAAVAICADIPFYMRASFLYWYAGEEGLSIASNGVLNNQLYKPSESTMLFPSFEYKPGFKVGLGYTFSREWTLYAEYTWLRGTHSTETSAPSGPTATGATEGVSVGTPVWAVNDWFLQSTTANQAISASNISSQWHYLVEFIDLVASRPFYEGRMLIVNPYGGLRAAWIQQMMKVSLTEAPNQYLFPTPTTPIVSKSGSHSWAIGPRAGLDVYCLLSKGFRLEGDMAANLLYTCYTKVFHEEDPASFAFMNQQPLKVRWNHYNCLRVMAECALGLGWGEYWQNEAYHIDFCLDYTFSYLWGQNMIRKLLDETLTRTASTASDMYFHGLTVTGRLDF